MAAPRIVIGDEGRFRDEESAKMEESPTSKKARFEGRLPLTRWEVMVAVFVFLVLSIGLFCIYLKTTSAEYGKIKLPRTISDLRLLKDKVVYIRSHYLALAGAYS